MANKITTVVEFVTDKAQTSVQRFRTSVADADGTVNKFKAGASSAFSSIQANVGTFAVAAGAALVTFGAKAVGAFQNVALEAGKFSDATGLAVEDASRWLEVAGDVGVSAGTIEGAFVKLNKAIGSGAPELEKYGIGLITAADGTADVNQTMLTAIKRIGAIKDPTERAAAAQAAFGRGYKEAAEIILGNADEIKKRLDEVSDAKVIDEAELDKARRFRKAMDDINDIVEDVTITVGEGLVPALTEVAETASDIRGAFNSIPKAPWIVQQWWDKASPLAWQRHTLDAVGKVGGTIKDWFGSDGEVPEAFEATTTAADLYVESLEQMHQSASEAAKVEADHADTLAKARDQADAYVSLLEQRGVKALADLADETDRARRSNKLLADAQRDVRQAHLDSLDTMFDYEQSVAAAWQANDNLRQVLEETPGDLWAVRDAQIAGAEAALDQAEAFAAQEGATAGSVLQAQLMKLELEALQQKFPGLSDAIQGYIDKLNEIPAMKTTQLVVTSTGAVTTKQTVNQFGRLVAGAEGAIVNRPTLALIGEAGPEAVVPLSQSPGNSPLPTNGTGGGARNVSVQIDGHTLFRIMWDETERQTRNGWRPGPGVRRVMAS